MDQRIKAIIADALEDNLDEIRLNRVLALASTVRFQMDVLKRRVQGKPGHQGVTVKELLAAARHDLNEIEKEMGV